MSQLFRRVSITPEYLRLGSMVAAASAALLGLQLVSIEGVGGSRVNLGELFSVLRRVHGGVLLLVGVFGFVVSWRKNRAGIRVFGGASVVTGLSQAALSIGTIVLMHQPATADALLGNCLELLAGAALSTESQNQICSENTRAAIRQITFSQIFVILVSIAFQICIVWFSVAFSRDPALFESKPSESIELPQIPASNSTVYTTEPLPTYVPQSPAYIQNNEKKPVNK
ncbi:hypothetical protein BDR26DRAFT_932435 [Obelidium mucronatum]|nr:hypothetical protein BDR26DRAFT_932435 [Obelidium mucronatum]